MKCSYVGCEKEGVHPPKPGGLMGWLCEEHYRLVENAVTEAANGAGVRNLLREWVRASGGAKVAARKMVYGTKESGAGR